MTISGEQGWCAGVALLVIAAAASLGCETKGGGCPQYDGGHPQSPPSGSCSRDGLECKVLVCRTMWEYYDCHCDDGTWYCSVAGASMEPCIDAGPQYSDLVTAEDTPDGLLPLTAEQAALLAPAACEGWSAEPDGGAACDLTVPAPPAGQIVDPSKVNIIYDDGAGMSYLVLPNSSTACDRGWRYTDDAHALIQVCSITCDLIRANPQASTSLVFGCLSGQVPS